MSKAPPRSSRGDSVLYRPGKKEEEEEEEEEAPVIYITTQHPLHPAGATGHGKSKWSVVALRKRPEGAIIHPPVPAASVIFY